MSKTHFKLSLHEIAMIGTLKHKSLPHDKECPSMKHLLEHGVIHLSMDGHVYLTAKGNSMEWYS